MYVCVRNIKLPLAGDHPAGAAPAGRLLAAARDAATI